MIPVKKDKLYKLRKSSRICTRCGKRKATIINNKQITKCKICRKKDIEYNNRKTKKKMGKSGIKSIIKPNEIYYDDPVELIERDPIFPRRI